MTAVELLALLNQQGITLSVDSGNLRISAPKGSMTNELRDELIRHKAEIIELLQADVSAAPDAITRIDRTSALPLSFAQERLWFLDQLEGQSTEYNIPSALRLTGKVHITALETALNQLLQRHETLRTCFSTAGRDPVAVINKDCSIALEQCLLNGDEQDLLTELAAKPFDLSKTPLMRATLIETNPDENILLVVVHHIVSDGWSLGVLMKELAELYAANIEQREPQLPSGVTQYVDYAAWQRQHLIGAELDGELNFWRRELSGSPTILELPADHARPVSPSYRGAWEHEIFPTELLEQLRELAREQNSTLYMLLLAAFNVLLYRYTRQEDILVGTPVAGRQDTAIENTIGLFVNSVIIRSELHDNLSFKDLLTATATRSLDALEHQTLPFEKLVEELQPERDSSYAPLFQVLFNMQSREQEQVPFAGLEVSPVIADPGTAKLDLTVLMEDRSDGLAAWFEYSTDLFDKATIQRMLGHYGKLLCAIIANPDSRIAALTLLEDAERNQLLTDWNDTRVAYPKDATLVSLFENQVKQNPFATALIFEQQRVSYAELNMRANQLAHYLRAEGVTSESLVGVCMERSIEMVVAIYGIQKAGGAYVPLDPEYPAQRLQHMLEDADISLLLSQSQFESVLPEHNARVIHLDTTDFSQQPGENLPLISKPDNAAYVIFTSGSTGRPKGVLNEHRGIVNRLLWMQSEYLLDTSDRILQKTPFSFDVSVWEFFWPLQTGATLVIAEPGGHRDPTYLARLIQSEQITTLHFVPSMLAGFMQEPTAADCTSLQRVICSGEALTRDLQHRFFATLNAELHNLYGPTEAAIDVTYWACDRDDTAATVPIGQPVANTQIYIVDGQNEPCPIGVPGELLIGGIQVARGYVNRAELTAERFTQDPFNPDQRVYRTGDLARFRPDGVIEFLGRIDFQVKLRGFRIELGEIEAELQQCDGIEQSAVILREDTPGDQRLVAYMVGHADTAAISSQLKGTLPDYMVPAAFIALDELPLTPNGKLDRGALPAPDWADTDTTEYVAPRTPTEEALIEIWQDLLGTNPIGTQHDFFQLGGHSLLATRLVARIRDTLNRDLPLKALFDNPTVAQLAAVLDDAQTDTRNPLTARPDRSTAPLSASQQRLWILDQIEPGNPVYNIPWATRLNGLLETDALQAAVNALIGRHESLRTRFIVADGMPIQAIDNATTLSINSLQLHDAGQNQLSTELTRLTQHRFDLSKGPLLKLTLISLGETEHVLHVVMHHIIGDAWSTDVLQRELAELYSAAAELRDAQLPDLPVQFADYAAWQTERLQAAELQTDLQYWKEKLAGAPAVLDLPTDRQRPAVQTFNGDWYELRLPADLNQSLKALANQQNATLYMVLMATFNLLLGRYAGQDDLVVGSPIAGRQQSELENLIGFFINTLAIRTSLNEASSFNELLAQLKQSSLEAYAHQELPFEQLVEELQPDRDTSYAPLFQVMFILQNAPVTRQNWSELEASPVLFDFGFAKLDLTLSMEESGDELVGYFEYNTDLFDKRTIAQLAGHLHNLLQQVVSSPDATLNEFELLTASERDTLLTEWNRTSADYPRDESLHAVVAAQALASPAATAVICGDRQLSYKELDEQSNQLAHRLIEAGAGCDVPIALCMDRSVDLIVGLLGILKSGSCYVPLDPDFPADRLRYMLEDSAAPVIVTESSKTELSAGLNTRVICLDQPDDTERPTTSPAVRVAPDQLAYIIYTSGSTGRPKGVAIEHRAAINFLYSMLNEPGIGKQDRLLAVTTLSFDISILEIFCPLLTSATVVLATKAMSTDGFALTRSLEQDGVTIMQATPATWRMLIQTGWQGTPGLKILCGGEALDPQLAAQLVNCGAELWNMYGPTETTIWSTCEQIHGDQEIITVGQPIANTQCYVLDEQRRPVPVGVGGELWIAGDGVAREYLNRPELTAEKFVADPFIDGNRMYSTGDLARWRADGRIEVLGRTDFQVKLRGFRIELGEIEAALAAMAEVEQCVTILREDTPGDQRLVAYMTASGTADIPEAETLREHLRAELPEYMVPAGFMRLDAFPLTPNGKVDRKQLPTPEWTAQQEYVAPRNELEAALADIWADVLGLEQVGIYDDFFALGGHSLLATQLISRVLDQLQIELSLLALFNRRTIAGLNEELAGRDTGAATSGITRLSRDEKLPLSFAQQRLWFLDELSPGDPVYNVPWVMELSGTLNKPALEKALDKVIARHESLRTIFPTQDGEAVQVILPELRLSIPEEDWRTRNPDELQQRITELAQVRMNIAEGPLLYLNLLQIADDKWLLTLMVHHIVFDAWSHGIFLRELSALYNAELANEQLALSPVEIEFADYAGWQRDWYGSKDFDHQLSYWKQKLAGAPHVLDLPTDFPRPPVQTSHGANISRMLSQELHDGAHALAEQQGSSLFHLLLATFNLLMGRYANQDDLLIGTPISGRRFSELEKIVGFFLHTLVIRSDMTGNPSFKEHLARTRQNVLEAFANQEMPFETLVEELDPERDTSRHPLFQVHFVLQHVDIDWQMFNGLTAAPVEFEFGTAKFDLMFFVFDTNNSLSVRLEYNTDLFEAETIERMIDHFEVLLGHIISEPETGIQELPLLNQAEKQTLLYEWNDTQREYPTEITLPGLFEDQVARTPNQTAVSFGSTSLSYAELNEKANQLAAVLKSRGVGEESLVGVFMERSLEMVASLYGILKAGGAYVPLDPEYPIQRLAHMIEDAEISLILVQPLIRDSLPEHSATVLELDKHWALLDGQPGANPTERAREEDAAYVIFTSGSTGRPKGVLNEHKGIVNRLLWMQEEYQLTAGDKVLQKTPFSFDVSVWEFFWPLQNGAELVVANPGDHKDSAKLASLIQQHEITTLHFVPSMLQAFLQDPQANQCESLQRVICSGEALPRDLQSRFHQQLNAELHNLYGPTEAAIDVTYWACQPDDPRASVPIGRPVANTSIYIVDQQGVPVPAGIAGELWIGGIQVARGYVNRPELTAERFISDPFSDDPNARVYRTGDLVRYTRDGVIEFLGRIDFQVKLRGFRIELGEIEAGLDEHPAVAQSIVLLREDQKDDQRLVAYVVAGSEQVESEELDQWQEEQVDQWQSLWQEEYEQESTAADAGFDIQSWDSSYTGKPIPAEEMREWLDSTTQRIRELKPQRAIEIGSGTGMIVAAVAPDCKTYTATDFSAAAVARLKRLCSGRENLQSVELKNCGADQLSEFTDRSFDTLILNSVAQYFPNIEYFVDFIRTAVDKISDEGHIFLGDLRSLPLLTAYHASVQHYQADDDLAAHELLSLIRQRTDQEEELLIDPALFSFLQESIPRLSAIRFELKRGVARNELSRFRYDVLLQVGSGTEAIRPQRVEWQGLGQLTTLQEKLQSLPTGGLLINAIPDARTLHDARLLEILTQAEESTAGDIRAALQQGDTGIEPEGLYRLAGELNLDLQLSGGDAGKMTALFRPAGSYGFDGELLQTGRHNRLSSYGNNPLHGKLQRSLVPLLRKHLQGFVPDYMIPATFVVMDEFPLTPNGKIDRQALPAPDRKRTEQEAYVAPETATQETLTEIWSGILGIERIGINDDFFALGGHSLLATQLASRIRDRLNIQLPLIALFNHPTIAGLAAEIDGSGTEAADAVITACDRSQPLPLSFAQQRLWFLNQLEGPSSTYNVPLAIDLEGNLNQQAMQAAIDALTARHESLRTSFAVHNGQAIQVIQDSLAIELDEVEMTDSDAEELQQKLEQLAQTPFDLSCDPLVRVHILKSDDTHHRLLLVMHHIVSDGWSLGILARELAALYAEHCGGKPASLPALPIQYPDYAVWQRDWLSGDELTRQLAYWEQQLDDAPALLQLPTDHPRQSVQTFKGAHINRTFDKQLGAKLKTLATQQDCTLFMTLLAAFNVLLQRYASSDDIVVGSPIAGRTRTEIEGLIGFFVNTLAMRTDLEGNPTFPELMQRVKRSAMGAYGHQELPFEKLVEEIRPDRDTSHSPIFQTLFVLQENLSDHIEFQDLKVTPLDFELGSAKFDLSLFMVEFPEGLTASFEYNTDLYEADAIERMLDQLETLLNAIAANPVQPINELPLLNAQEQQNVLEDFNQTATASEDITVHALVERQAAATPDACAVSFAGAQLSYLELNERANQLARELYSQGARPGTLIGISLERGLDMAVSVLATLKSGAAYVPIDPNYPADRVSYMLTDSQAPVLLTQSNILQQLPELTAVSVCIDEFNWDDGNTHNLEDIHGKSVYAIYTSGSTGQPKGVELTHAGLSNLIQWQNSQPGLDQPARTLQFASLSFDVSFQEFFITWSQGGTVVLIDEELRRDLPRLAEFIATENIERVYLPFAALQPLADNVANTDRPYSVKDVIVAGEQLQITPTVRAMFEKLPAARLHNQYGPSETHVVTAYTLSSSRDNWMPLPPIGKPVANTRVYVLDDKGEPVPVGVPGELWLGGVQVAKGYLHRPELTGEKFRPDTFVDAPGHRMYRTGDRVRFLADGNLEYLGRTDDQVKWRGFRIEPGEIETLLAEHEAVRQAAVLLREDTPGDKRLVAYLIALENERIDTAKIRDWIKARVPDYMVPSAFVTLEALPVTPSGKIARRKLPVPDYQEVASIYVPPRNPTEEALVEIWAEVLGIPQAGIHDDFFDLGGHSLLATQLISRVRDTLDADLELITLFNQPTPAGLAAEVIASSGQPKLDSIKPCDRNQPLPLSFAQQRLWFLDQLEPGNPVYNIPWAMRLDGPLNMQALQSAINDLIQRHETLRTLFSVTMGKPQQCVLEKTAVPVESVDATGDNPEAITERLKALARIPFGLSQSPLMRVHVLHIGSNQHIILLVVHHIISDGWSLSVLYQELVKLYEGHCTGKPPLLPDLPIQYADYSVWQHDWFRGAGQQQQLEYWTERLRGAPSILELPTDRPRGATQTYNGSFVEQVLPEKVHAGLKTLAREEQSTLFMVCLTAFNVLLSRYSGQEDICVGTPIAGRRHTDLEGLIGFFINTLVMRNDLSGDPAFTDVLTRVKSTALDAFANQELPFEKLVDELHPTRDMSHAPLFQVAFILQNTPWDQSAELHDLEISPIELDYGVSKFDLSLVMAERREGLLVHFEYNTDLYEHSTIERMAGHFETMLTAIIAERRQPITQLPLLTAAERQQSLVEWNNTTAPYEDDTCIHTLIEKRVAQQPDAPAVFFREESYSFNELNQRANRIAHFLRSKGAGPGKIIGLCLERSPDLVAALIGIFKSGAAYVPLDPKYPLERLDWMLTDSSAPLVITHSSLLTSLPDSNAETLCIDQLTSEIEQQPTYNTDCITGPDDLAWVIYTSGSTGKPKGVMIPHRGACNLADAQARAFELGPDDRMLQFASISFDASIFELIMGLQVGAAMVIAPQDDLLPGEPLLDVLKRHQVTAVTLPPTALMQLPAASLTQLKTITVAGEACPPELVANWAHNRRFFNLYGPTESTVWASYTQCFPEEAITIGKPISNARLYILDENLQPQPVGVPGELCIGGAGLALGYLNRPELSAEKFLPDPFRDDDARIYRTGDRVRFLPDGNIEFLGRIDHQMKVRGFRIEAGEIEAALADFPGLRESVVIARGETLGEQRLVAYLVAETNADLSLAELRSHLKQSLPEFMVPQAFVVLDEFPLTPNGKVDRKALPAPEEEQRLALEVEYVAPASPTEIILAEIWCELLNLEQVGVHDNFFELGGDSILSIQIIARAGQAGLHLSPKQLFQHQTIAELASAASTESVIQAEQDTVSGPVPLTPIQKWFVARDLKQPQHFNQSMLLECSQEIDTDALESALQTLVEHHDALRLHIERVGDNWQQEIAPQNVDDLVAGVNLADHDEASQDKIMERLATAMQGNFNLSEGPLIRAAVFRLGQRADRIVLVIHHIAVDWVSWAVLLEDLDTAYRAIVDNREVRLPLKTSSFKAWSEALVEYTNGEALQDELTYWQEQPWNQAGKLTVDRPAGDNLVGNARDITLSLNRDETRQLLQDIPRAWRAQINDVLLAALASTVAEWTDSNHVLINLESHGREELFNHLDISRTVGWFTTLYPVLFSVNDSNDPSAVLNDVKTTLNNLPDNGIGYGMLRYLSRDSGTRNALAEIPDAEIGFNYLGQIDKATSGDNLFSMASGVRGLEQGQDDPRPHALDIHSAVSNEQLQISVIYSSGLWDEDTLKTFAQNYIDKLRELTAACLTKEQRAYAPSDFPLADITQEQLDQVLTTDSAIADIYRVTSLQHGMLFHSLFTGEKDVYFARFRWRLSGHIDTEAFAAAWQKVVDRNDSLRTSFRWEGFSKPVQIVHQHLDVPMQTEDWSADDKNIQEDKLQEHLAQDENQRFDFTQAPLLRLALIRLGEDDHHFIWSFHHAIVDGWSVPLVLKEVFAAYAAITNNQPLELPESKPFSDYLRWLDSQDESAAEQFWRGTMTGFTTPTPLPAAVRQQALSGSQPEFHEITAQVSADTVDRLRKLAQRSRLTLNTIMQGAWAILLSRYSGESDIVFGATTSGRPASMPGVEKMVGLFLNTLPVRTAVDQQANLLEWLQSLQSNQLDARQHEHASLVEIQGWSDVPRGTPMFESLLAFENYPEMETMWTNTDTIDIREVDGFDRTNFPLTVNIGAFDKLHARIAYDTRFFDTASVEQLFTHLRTLLEHIADAPDTQVGDLSMLDNDEAIRISAWNDTGRDYPQDATLISLIEAQVAASPDAPAVTDGQATLTYAELNVQANQLAYWLRNHGVSLETPVGVCMERCNELMVTLLGILKAGGAYVPIDPEYPEQRIAHMLEDARINHLISQTHLLDQLPDLQATLFMADTEWSQLDNEPTDNPSRIASPNNLAYVIFTSGSTGRPKGVLNEHRGIVNRLLWMQDEYGLDASDSVLQKTPFSFDVSVWEFFWPLLTGARLVMAKPGGHRDTGYLTQLIQNENITTMHFVPPMLQVFLQDTDVPACTSLQRVICSGEALPFELTERFHALLPAELHNLYGPTEAAIDVSYWACLRDTDDSTVPIGAPVANTKLYVVDESGHQCPVGVPGELWIGGVQVARGYINRPELTSASFIDNPFDQGRVYKTGDLVKWRADGNIEFLGRIDHQIKLRGFRIELGEIENQLAVIPAVEQSVVLLREDTPGLKQLVAYVQCNDPDNFDTEAAIASLTAALPEYMVPAAFVALHEFPLTPNGKLDRKALPAPDTQIKQNEYIAPRDETEEQLVLMWQELLGVEQVGVQDDFFSLGGHSLVAMQVVSRIMQSLGVQLPLESLFEAPTIEGLAQSVKQLGDNTAATPDIQRISRKKRRTRRKRDE
ncbi:MAG: non-ribosomal peptide synthase/polyketide synthase [Gammaproteobacteria bacterium]